MISEQTPVVADNKQMNVIEGGDKMERVLSSQLADDIWLNNISNQLSAFQNFQFLSFSTASITLQN